MPTLLILLSVTCSSLAHLAFKVGVNRVDGVLAPGSGRLFVAAIAGNPYILGGLFLHAAALGTWLLALRKVDISYAYPFIALGFVLVLGLSSWFLDERLNAARLLGVALIVGGVFCVARS
ncbi:MAG TPA: EamA family transporter [Methylomirabilota bacterium]|nr:EamA family transporter [Methylomirabilota bacterium]